jgi:murein DD-endopeptidase MepM/ murein hydrolase activator NlpD
MRGIIYRTRENESLRNISIRHGIDEEYICKVNKINGGIKEFLFIPCGEVSEIERSLFLGVGFANPLKGGRRTSAFGNRIDPFNKRFQFHCGIDLACPRGSKVYASRDGIITFTGYNGGYGRLVIIKHQHGYNSYYGHLSTIYVKAGASVKRGELLGLTGSSGRSTGPHLHFEVRKDARPVNPGVLLSVK